MHPVLFEWGSLTIYTYGLFTALAVFAAFAVCVGRAERFGFERGVIADLLFFIFISGVIGARLFFVLQHWDDYRTRPLDLFYLREGGLVWYGGFITAVVAGAVYARWRRWPVALLLEYLTPAMPLVHAIGRIGCFMNGCCGGRPIAHLPLQWVEAVFLFLLSTFLFFLQANSIARGRLFLIYVAAYSVARFLFEFLRADQQAYGSLTAPQWTSIILFAVAAAALVFKRRAAR